MTPRVKRPKKKTGPKEGRLKLTGDWKDAVKTSLGVDVPPRQNSDENVTARTGKKIRQRVVKK